MKKFLIAAVALVALTTATPSYAGNTEEVIIGVMGGVIGGLVLGEVLEAPRYYAPPPPPPVYYEEPAMVRQCVTKYKRYYDSMGNLVRRPVKKCFWVERY
jgi:hypothetical protein